MVDVQKRTFLERFKAAEHISAGDVCVRSSMQDVSIMPKQGKLNAYGQAGPGLGRNHKDPELDVPAGFGPQVKAMYLAKTTDPKSSLINKLPTKDDEHTLDPTGITYGNQTKKINTRPPMYGAQRTLVSAYQESLSFAERCSTFAEEENDDETDGEPEEVINCRCTTIPVGEGAACCKAFPEGVPEELYTSVADHTEPYPGDNGIRFEKYTGNLDLDGNPRI